MKGQNERLVLQVQWGGGREREKGVMVKEGSEEEGCGREGEEGGERERGGRRRRREGRKKGRKL